MKDPMKPRDKITQKMSRDGLTEQNQTTGESELISKRIQDADFQKTPEQQAAQDAAQLQGAVSPSSPLPHAPEHFSKPQDAAAERVMEHIGAGQTRKASKKAVRRAQEAAASKAQPSRLQFTDEERATPELEKYIKKSDKAADRLDAARAALPPKKKSRLQFDKQETPPSFEGKRNPLSRPAQEAGIFVHNKIHSVEKDNSGVEGAHKSEEAAERMGKYGVRKVKERRQRQTPAFTITKPCTITRSFAATPFPVSCRSIKSSGNMQKRQGKAAQPPRKKRRKAPARRQRKPPRKQGKPRSLWQGTR